MSVHRRLRQQDCQFIKVNLSYLLQNSVSVMGEEGTAKMDPQLSSLAAFQMIQA